MKEARKSFSEKVALRLQERSREAREAPQRGMGESGEPPECVCVRGWGTGMQAALTRPGTPLRPEGGRGTIFNLYFRRGLRQAALLFSQKEVSDLSWF